MDRVWELGVSIQLLLWRHPWRWLYQEDADDLSGADPSPGPLENQRKNVIEQWNKFCHLYPCENQALSDINNLPTIATLREEVQRAESAWHSKQDKGFRVVKNRFLNFAETMSDYSYLFSIVPSGDKYTSLITGVVSSVVKA
jgi:hypothetical protein